MVSLAFLVGNFNREHGGAQQLLFDICSHLPAEFDATVYYMFGEGTFEPAFQEAGVSVVDLDADSNYDLRAFRRLVSELRRHGPDVLHTNSPVSGIWGRTAGSLARVPAVLSAEHNVHDSYRPFVRYANGLSLPLANVAVGVGKTVTESMIFPRLLAATGVDRRTILNGVDVARIESKFEGSEETFRRETGIGPGEIVAGTVGRLCEQKGFDVLLEAFPSVLDRVPDARAVVVGDGPARESLERQAETLGIADAVVFTGYVESVYPLLPHFDVAAFPSRWEGLPLAPAEAMVARRPIVASEIPSMAEVVGDAGMLVPPERPEPLGDSIAELLADRPLRESLGDRGYRRVEQRLSIDRTVEEYVELYRDLVDDR